MSAAAWAACLTLAAAYFTVTIKWPRIVAWFHSDPAEVWSPLREALRTIGKGER